ASVTDDAIKTISAYNGLCIMDDRIEKLAEKAKCLPKAPGVYLMKDDKGRVIYVGKSASLRDRVCSYFQPATKLEFKKAPLRDVVVDFDYIQTESEVEALLAENRLIKDIQPKFNARLLDDKTFPYLMVTTDEDFPGVYVTREPRTKGVRLYGPFTSVYQLKEAVTLSDEIKALQGVNQRAKKGEQQYWQPEAFISDPKEGVTALQEALALAEPPRIIEGIDIAHLQGGETVGSKVCFIDGVPFKD